MCEARSPSSQTSLPSTAIPTAYPLSLPHRAPPSLPRPSTSKTASATLRSHPEHEVGQYSSRTLPVGTYVPWSLSPPLTTARPYLCVVRRLDPENSRSQTTIGSVRVDEDDREQTVSEDIPRGPCEHSRRRRHRLVLAVSCSQLLLAPCGLDGHVWKRKVSVRFVVTIPRRVTSWTRKSKSLTART